MSEYRVNESGASRMTGTFSSRVEKSDYSMNACGTIVPQLDILVDCCP